MVDWKIAETGRAALVSRRVLANRNPFKRQEVRPVLVLFGRQGYHLAREMQHPSPERRLVRGPVALLMAAFLTPAVVAAGTAGTSADGQKKRPRDGQARQQARETSLTGCVDQVEGQYVLVEEGSMKRLAALRAETFDQEGFAKHVGQKVAARGTLSNENGAPVLRVRSVKTVSESCPAPQGVR